MEGESSNWGGFGRGSDVAAPIECTVCTFCLDSLSSLFFGCSSNPADVAVLPSPRRSLLGPSVTPVDHMGDLQIHGTLELLRVLVSSILPRLFLHILS